jgi:hypothetical protein
MRGHDIPRIDISTVRKLHYRPGHIERERKADTAERDVEKNRCRVDPASGKPATAVAIGLESVRG